jgi:hypothetical protein
VPPEIASSIFGIGGMSTCNKPTRIWTTHPIAGLSLYQTHGLEYTNNSTSYSATSFSIFQVHAILYVVIHQALHIPLKQLGYSLYWEVGSASLTAIFFSHISPPKYDF